MSGNDYGVFRNSAAARSRALAFLASWMLAGCGGGAVQSAESPASPPDTVAAAPEAAPAPPEEPSSGASEADDDAAEEEPGGSSAAPPPEPEFTRGMSVEEAIRAVPRDAERLNLDDDRLAAPLQDPALYEPCNVGSSHFKLRIAVWNGRAVGIDIDTKNARLAQCLRERLEGLEWPDKVPSLNTIEYAM